MTPPISISTVQKNFQQGVNCAQQVFSHFAPRAGVSEHVAMRVAAAFGSGMGNAEVCGCASGALMIIGLLHGPKGFCTKEERAAFEARCKAFTAAFAKTHGGLCCRDILGCDVTTPEGMAAAREQELFATVCAPLVCATCALLEEHLQEPA